MRIGERREPALVLLFSIISCGIYYLYYIYKVSEEISIFQGRYDYSPGTEILLTLVTCGIWNCFWDYRVGKRIAEMNVWVGLPPSDNSILYLILDLLGLGLINGLIQQDALNRIWLAAQTNAANHPSG
jgi:hypothetical protein